jgi:hypothetical protein
VIRAPRERVDESGALASHMLEADGFEIAEYKMSLIR